MTERHATRAAIAALAAGAVLGAAPAPAQETAGEDEATWVEIRSWKTEDLYDGWSAEALLDEAAHGEDGEVVGEVEDFLIGTDGRIVAVVVEGDGFMDIGDVHLAVPWDQVSRTGTERITVPLTEANMTDFGLFETVDDMEARPGSFRLRELLGDQVTADGIGYGTVTDVVFGPDGGIGAVIVSPAHGYGYRSRPVGVPYRADRHDPWQPYYAVPYSVQELEEIAPFNYGRME